MVRREAEKQTKAFDYAQKCLNYTYSNSLKLFWSNVDSFGLWNEVTWLPSCSVKKGKKKPLSKTQLANISSKVPSTLSLQMLKKYFKASGLHNFSFSRQTPLKSIDEFSSFSPPFPSTLRGLTRNRPSVQCTGSETDTRNSAVVYYSNKFHYQYGLP